MVYAWMCTCILSMYVYVDIYICLCGYVYHVSMYVWVCVHMDTFLIFSMW